MPQSGPGASVRPSCHAPVVPVDDDRAGEKATDRTPVWFCTPRRQPLLRCNVGDAPSGWMGLGRVVSAGLLALLALVGMLLVLSAPTLATEPPETPTIAAEQAPRVGSATATLSAEIDPNGLPTRYHVEYVTEAQFQAHQWSEASRVPATDAELPAVTSPVAVSESVSGLQAATVYRFRFFAENASGSVVGSEATLTTVSLTAASSALPDDRVYELVSPPTEGELYLPPEGEGQSVAATGFRSNMPFRVAADGNAVAWVGEPAASVGTGATGPGEGNEWLSTRAAQGWSSADITQTGAEEAVYQSFSSNLATAFEEGGTHSPLVSGVPKTCGTLYSLGFKSGVLRPLFSAEHCGRPLFAGASADESQIIFQDQLALTQNSKEATEVPPGHEAESHAAPGGQGAACMYGCNLYDLVGGQLQLVNILPGPEEHTVPNATFGGYAGSRELTNFSHAISNDGSRIFWTDTQAGPDLEHVYVRENGTTTVQVSGADAAEYWTATPDGRYAFYTEDGELWRFDTDTQERVALTPASYGATGTGSVVGPGTGTGTTTEGSNVVTEVVTSTGAFAIGQEIKGVPGEGCGFGCIPEGATITAVGSGTITLSVNATASDSNFGIAADSDEITSLTTTSGHFHRGEEVFAPGVPAGTKITGVTANTIRLSRPATAPGAGVAVKAGGSEVQGVIGANETGEDGADVYFVADGGLGGATGKTCVPIPVHGSQLEQERIEGVITAEQAQEEFQILEQEEAEEDQGQTPPTTGCSLYLSHGSRITLVATLAPQDNSIKALAGGAKELAGDWVANLGERIAQVAPDGQHLVFQSHRALTGYDNRFGRLPQLEVYVYSAGDGTIACGSCDQTGAPPTNAGGEEQTKLPESSEYADTYMRRLISENGNRVFFMTEQALVPQDTNGVLDVYEWEREGEATCTPSIPARPDGGCVFLLSGGDSRIDSFLVEGDATGENVFFEHIGPLGQVEAPIDHNLLFDARVNGGFPTTSQACTGTGCQGVPPAPPLFASPPSATFSGTGNFPPPQPTKPVVKPLTRAQKLARALKVCKRDKKKRKRTSCEAQARKRYGVRKAKRATVTVNRANNERRAQS